MKHPKENVLVIPTALAAELCPTQFGKPRPELERTILGSHSFRDREEAETNFSFKQVIPYIVVVNRAGEAQYLLTQRTSQQQETRLHNKFSIGQGGHINDHDFKSKDPILTGLMREVREEFKLAPEYGCSMIGLINDNSSEVAMVHFGLVYELRVSSLLLEVAEQGKHVAQWADVQTLRRHYEVMENWSKLVMDHVICAS